MRICEGYNCGLPAEWNVRTPRGENIDVCSAHRDTLVASLVGQAVVTKVEP